MNGAEPLPQRFAGVPGFAASCNVLLGGLDRVLPAQDEGGRVEQLLAVAAAGRLLQHREHGLHRPLSCRAEDAKPEPLLQPFPSRMSSP